ncbi:glycosyltransferase family 25 protein [Paralcaligenes sp. KSB-10]|uniref:glycosyltransferase family 25 protein n=1 Tax=Paralcaligenes sp. KSB-10 TaxID=2901142 RepID=UPI001E38B70B|nr:glycosyltransferase family 25 protein [Paralcaligenes sp. KSB-10]UHL65853.1 glycosyltransferase family 25 protein [Paralcaligenes sp. KSB-10]
MPKPVIHVVSLASATNRRDFMRRQLQELSVDYLFFDAVNGAENPHHYLFDKYNDKKRARRKGKGTPLRTSQLGCFASHYLLWEKCVRDGQAIIVLEDDAILLAPFMPFYEIAEQFADKYGFVWIQPSNKIKDHRGLILERIGPFTVKKFAKGFSHTAGYLITPGKAQALLDYCSEWIYPVDDTMDRFFEHKVEAIGLDPFCIRPDESFESSINVAAPGPKRSWSDVLRREFANLADTVKRATHNMLFSIRQKRH